MGQALCLRKQGKKAWYLNPGHCSTLNFKNYEKITKLGESPK